MWPTRRPMRASRLSCTCSASSTPRMAATSFWPRPCWYGPSFVFVVIVVPLLLLVFVLLVRNGRRDVGDVFIALASVLQLPSLGDGPLRHAVVAPRLVFGLAQICRLLVLVLWRSAPATHEMMLYLFVFRNELPRSCPERMDDGVHIANIM